MLNLCTFNIPLHLLIGLQPNRDLILPNFYRIVVRSARRGERPINCAPVRPEKVLSTAHSNMTADAEKGLRS
ncbi:hypothetical protein ILYODFUR_023270 [Ilyodon furcidens]|uniref:Uncharacterized protein n=1 Tax=Ilyodon furcidens TaxID=33524 RepID=A0ABV0UKC1_9TELE